MRLEKSLIEIFERPAAAIHDKARLYEHHDLDSMDVTDPLIRMHESTGARVQAEPLPEIDTQRAPGRRRARPAETI